MAFAPTPRFTNQSQQPVVIQNQMPKDQPTDVSGSIPGSGQGNSFRLIPSQGASSGTGGTGGTNLTLNMPYGSGTTGMPTWFDTVSGPGASYNPPAGGGGGQTTQNPQIAGSVRDFPGLLSDTSPWTYRSPTGGSWAGQDPTTGRPIFTGAEAHYQAPQTDGGGSMRMAYGSQPVGGNFSMATTGATDNNGSGGKEGGGGGQYTPPVPGGGTGGGAGRPGSISEWQGQRTFTGPASSARVGFYHPNTGISYAGSPYAQGGYGNPQGQWNPSGGRSGQAPPWLGGGGGATPGGGGGGAPGGISKQPNPDLPMGPGAPGGGPNLLYGQPMGGGGFEDARRKDNRLMDSTNRMTAGGPGAGMMGAAFGGGPEPAPGGGLPPFPSFDPANPPTPQALAQMMQQWWAQWQAANPNAGPPRGATGVSNPIGNPTWGNMTNWPGWAGGGPSIPPPPPNTGGGRPPWMDEGPQTPGGPGGSDLRGRPPYTGPKR